MIVPRYRLIFFAALVVLPLSMLYAIRPSFFSIAVFVTVAFLLLSIADAAMGRNSLQGIRAEFPEIVRMTKDREGELEVRIDNDRGKAKRLRIGIAFPAGISSAHDEIATVLPETGGQSIVTWPCTGLTRGNYTLENIYIETSSPLGFWAIRKASPSRAEVRVYPGVLREQKNLAALFLNRGMLGMHTQRQVGKGREFEKLREYIPGDGYEDIHWKATAKRSHPITKVYQIERTQEVYVVIDGSRLSSRVVEQVSGGSSSKAAAVPTTQLERFVTAALVLGLVAEKQGDLFGLVAFSDQIRRFVRAKSGKVHYGTCREALYTLQPELVNPDFGEASSFIRLRLRRRALLIFLTSLDDPVLSESFVKNLDVLGRHHLVLVNMLTAPGVAPLFSDTELAGVDDLYQRLGGHIQWQKLRELEKVLKRRGVSMSLLDNEMMCPQLVSQYINVKRRQLL